MTTKLVKQNSTHKAVKVGSEIKIYLKGIEIEDLKTFKIKAKTVIAIISVLFSTAITILGWFVS